jgi:hypothetical protein
VEVPVFAPIATRSSGLQAVPEPERVLEELGRLNRQLRLTRELLRLSEKVHGRPALTGRPVVAPATGASMPSNRYTSPTEAADPLDAALIRAAEQTEYDAVRVWLLRLVSSGE